MTVSLPFVRRVFDFILFTSIFIALCAVGMIWQTYELFNVPLHFNYFTFVFFGCLCSYNFHWYLTPQLYSDSYKTRWSVLNKKAHLFLFAMGLIMSAWYATKLLNYWNWLLLTDFVSFLYSAPKIPISIFKGLKKIAIGKTIFLSLVWTHSTVILPLVISSSTWQE
ncbi:MAG TPA: hypothetical protein VM935_10560, partial [Chitinophagaceae bacterium]|nr:hypothetical protein [Chitinophagaceae bacterium]